MDIELADAVAALRDVHGLPEAVPAYVLHHDEGFRAALRELAGMTMVLEPIEWQHLIDDTPGIIAG